MRYEILIPYKLWWIELLVRTVINEYLTNISNDYMPKALENIFSEF